MAEPAIDHPKKPGIVIFTAVLNFLTAFFLFLVSAIFLAVLLFGNILGLYNLVTKQITQYYGQVNLSLGLNVIFGILGAIGLLFAIFYLFIGLGLLKGKKLAWYFQIALSVLGALGFPVGTIINLIILVLFFQRNVRAYFKV